MMRDCLSRGSGFNSQVGLAIFVCQQSPGVRTILSLFDHPWIIRPPNPVLGQCDACLLCRVLMKVRGQSQFVAARQHFLVKGNVSRGTAFRLGKLVGSSDLAEGQKHPPGHKPNDYAQGQGPIHLWTHGFGPHCIKHSFVHPHGQPHTDNKIQCERQPKRQRQRRSIATSGHCESLAGLSQFGFAVFHVDGQSRGFHVVGSGEAVLFLEGMTALQSHKIFTHVVFFNCLL